MTRTTQRTDETEILALSGRFDAYAAPPITAWFAEQTTDPSGPVRVVADMAAVSFIDSTALATLVQGMKRCRQTGGDLRLCGLQQSVRIIFELTRLDRAFAIHGTTDEAIASFKG